MRNLFSYFKPKVKPKVEVGQHYFLRRSPSEKGVDPFKPKNNRSTSCILEIKDGWVRYRIGNGLLYDDERLTIKLFLSIYRLVE